MVLKLDCNSEIGLHVCSAPGYLICVRHLFGSETVKSDFFKNLPIFLHTRETCSNIPSNLVDTINFKKKL